MRQVVFERYGTADVLSVADGEQPKVGPHDVLVKIHATSVNPIDWKIRKGINRAVIRKKFPATLGLDFSGVVVAVGEHATFQVGDEVFGSPNHKRGGTYSELIAVDCREIALKPKSLSHLEAATLPLVGLTAWGCLVDAADIQPGNKVFVEAGSGGVGSFAIQLAKALGAEVATNCSEKNHEFVTSLGADHVIDYRKDNFAELLPAQDVVLECMGGASQKNALRVLRRGGHLTSINSNLAPKAKRYGAYLGIVSVALSMLWLKLWAKVRHGVTHHAVVRKASGENLAQIARLVDAGKIRATVDKVYPLEQIRAAHEHSESGRARGKIAVAVATS